ncbi:thioredoxin family protein [Polaribacter sargassicola]|uniref:thioredoxin family protein n=1 Tax=Polaribacter sargassicola TaxID=2836891 RepID=UPI001F419D7C|nr:thioredoxin family protein [Polaribacter sp. DS7-9]MCG1034844.1 thioredoxin family protein [Polaribacter sp. DS7-9]
MAKFGELISVDKPVLIKFCANSNDTENQITTLTNVAATLRENAKVIKINVAENKALVDALEVQNIPTFMICKKGEIKWRQAGFKDDKTLIGLVLNYV